MTNFELRLHTKNLIVSKIQFLKFFLFIYFQFGYYFVSKILRRVTWIEKEVKNFIFVFLWNFIYFLNIFSINVWKQNFELLIKIIFLFAESWFVFWPQLQNDYKVHLWFYPIYLRLESVRLFSMSVSL